MLFGTLCGTRIESLIYHRFLRAIVQADIQGLSAIFPLRWNDLHGAERVAQGISFPERCDLGAYSRFHQYGHGRGLQEVGLGGIASEWQGELKSVIE